MVKKVVKKRSSIRKSIKKGSTISKKNVSKHNKLSKNTSVNLVNTETANISSIFSTQVPAFDIENNSNVIAKPVIPKGIDVGTASTLTESTNTISLSSESNIVSNNKTLNNIQVPSTINESIPVSKDTTVPKIIDFSLLKIVSICIGALILLFWIIIIVGSITINPGPHVVQKNVTVLSYESIKSPYGGLSNVTDINYVENVLLTGYLSEEIINMSDGNKQITRYVVDANKNKIILVLDYAQDNYVTLFNSNTISSKIYAINGTYHYGLDRYVVDVSTITELTDVRQTGTKFLRPVRKQQMENIIEGKERGIEFSVEKGIVNFFSIFN